MTKVTYVKLRQPLQGADGLLSASRFRVHGLPRDGKDVAEMWIDREIRALQVRRMDPSLPLLTVPLEGVDHLEVVEEAPAVKAKKAA